jgi:hypothetical protein
LNGPLPKWCPAVALSRQDGRHSAVALLLKAALIQVSDYRLLGASGFSGPLYCLSFFLWAIVLFVILSLGRCIVCHFFSGPLYCLSFFLWAIVLFVIFSLAHCIVCHFFSGPLYCLSFFYYVFFNLPLRYLQTFLSGAGVGGGVVIFQRHSSNMVCYISSFTKLELTEIVDERCYICLG